MTTREELGLKDAKEAKGLPARISEWIDGDNAKKENQLRWEHFPKAAIVQKFEFNVHRTGAFAETWR